jgi:hypothetical protein
MNQPLAWVELVPAQQKFGNVEIGAAGGRKSRKHIIQEGTIPSPQVEHRPRATGKENAATLALISAAE